MKSALLARLEPPTRSSPRARGPALPRASPPRRGRARAGPSDRSVETLASLPAKSIASNMLRSLLEPAGPSVPSPQTRPSRLPGRDVGDSGAELHVGFGVVREGHAVLLDEAPGPSRPSRRRGPPRSEPAGPCAEGRRTRFRRGGGPGSPARSFASPRAPSSSPPGGSGSAIPPETRSPARPGASRVSWCRWSGARRPARFGRVPSSARRTPP